MGVPKFFRFISERYPCLSEVVKEYELPEFDNFYIDANGIIHNCSHPDDSVHFRISEEAIFREIFHYLEMLFTLIKPKKLFFIAIDGVAPRAKMNQQRSRRFRTAKDSEKAEKEALLKGEKLPETERFDSNCITPGTVFMDRLHRQLQYFIRKKISTESLWQKPKIILSGHNVPGEGEHKIMDYIRYLRSRDDWNPNTRHCLHGLDADLIMLGLCTHEPHFSLLREEVKFGKQQKRKTNIEEIKFFLLHLSLMRDYLDLEFQSLKKGLPFPYDIERIIDDWVLMGFLVGNDFIPHLPQFHIANNALTILYKAYMDILPTLDGYINNHGTLNLERFEKYLRKLAEVDFETFKDFSADLKYFESKTGKKFPGTGGDEIAALELDLDDVMNEEIKDLANQTELLIGGFSKGSSEESLDSELREEFRMFKADFYKNKLEYDKVDREVLMDQAEGYIRAIQWNLLYYYEGCPSWSWYYPHHYSPYVSDIKDFSGMDLTFPPSRPFLPFQQLLAVLPAASKSIIPEAFRELMCSPESPIINFYPKDFETDLNGKQHDWEAVVLIPFIDENSLVSAMDPYYKDLSSDEVTRNSVKAMEIYQYTEKNLGRYDAPEYFPPIAENHADLRELYREEIALKPGEIVKGKLPGAQPGAYLGFPSLRGISFTAKLTSLKVKVFDHPSRGDNMILKVAYKEISNASEVERIAADLLGKVVFVGWPHIQRGKVTSIHAKGAQYKLDSGKVRKFEEKDVSYAIKSEEILKSQLMSRGIDLHKIDVVVYVQTVGDLRYTFEGGMATLDYLWSKYSVAFPYQTTLESVNLLKIYDGIGEKKELSEVFTGKPVIVLDREQYYGALGLVIGVAEGGNIKVEVTLRPDPDLTGILDLSTNTDLKYYPGHIAGQRLGLGGHLFSRVTGSVFIQNVESEEKLNVGLGLKFNKQNEEVMGFSRRQGTTWFYSEKCIALLDDYMKKFPELFEYLEKHSGNDVFFNVDVFPDKSKEKLQEIRQWLKSQPHFAAERRPSGSKLLTAKAIQEVERRTSAISARPSRTEIVYVKPEKLYIASEHPGKAPPDPSVRVQLLDRVISIRRSHNIPLGLMGTVIGYGQAGPGEDTLYDVLFDEGVPRGRCLEGDVSRLYRLPLQGFVNVSHGRQPYQSKPPKKEMAFHTNNKDDKKTAPPVMKESSPNINHIDNNKVKEFFSGYANAEKALSGGVEKRGGAQEFQDMWNILRLNQQSADDKQHYRREERPKMNQQIPQPAVVDSAVKEQTDALKKLLKLNPEPGAELKPQQAPQQQQPRPLMELRPQVPQQPIVVPSFPPQQLRAPFVQSPAKPCGHVSCLSDLRQICTSKRIGFPLFMYNRIQSSGEILCTVTFVNKDLSVVSDACLTEKEAGENAACKAIRQILLSDEKRAGGGGGPRLPVSARTRGSTSAAHRGGTALPPPPRMWTLNSGQPWLHPQPPPPNKPLSASSLRQSQSSKNAFPQTGGVDLPQVTGPPPASAFGSQRAGAPPRQPMPPPASTAPNNISNARYPGPGGGGQRQSAPPPNAAAQGWRGGGGGGHHRPKQRPRIAANFTVPLNAPPRPT